MFSAYEEHLRVSGQGPEVVGDDLLKSIRNEASLLHDWNQIFPDIGRFLLQIWGFRFDMSLYLSCGVGQFAIE